MATYIEQAKVMSKGQVTIPKEIRDILSLKDGDKVCFIVNDNQIILENSFNSALKIIQMNMKNEAKNASIKNENDVVESAKQIRK